MESYDSQSVYDAEEEQDCWRPLWRRGYFRRLILPFCMSLAMFAAATIVFRLKPQMVGSLNSSTPSLSQSTCRGLAAERPKGVREWTAALHA